MLGLVVTLLADSVYERLPDVALGWAVRVIPVAIRVDASTVSLKESVRVLASISILKLRSCGELVSGTRPEILMELAWFTACTGSPTISLIVVSLIVIHTESVSPMRLLFSSFRSVLLRSTLTTGVSEGLTTIPNIS